jgi:hypothetical protein
MTVILDENNKIDKVNNIDNMLKHIVNEKNKLEKLTKKVINNKVINNKVINKVITNKNNRINTVKNIKINKDFDDLNFNNISPETSKKILELLKNYVNMDKSFRVKHEALKTLYNAYIELYKKYKDNTNKYNNEISNLSHPEHKEILKNIHSEMKDNNSNLYKERLMILKKIKDTPDIHEEMKNNICGRLLVIFKAPPVSNYTQLPMLEQGNFNISNIFNSKNNTENNEGEKIDVNELDDAYLQKHNELMTVYNAYQNLYNVVLNYKDQLDKYKQLPTGSSISRNHMDKLIKDQGFVMDMIDKMQDQLVSKNIISNSEKVPVNPVTSHPENIGTFNNTMRDQIRHIIDRQVEVKPDMKTKIEDLLGKYKDCDSNDKFCQSGRQLILLKKM